MEIDDAVLDAWFDALTAGALEPDDIAVLQILALEGTPDPGGGVIRVGPQVLGVAAFHSRKAKLVRAGWISKV